MEPDRTIARLAERQFGLFSLEQARLAGLGEDRLRRRVRAGRYRRVAEGVLMVAGVPPGWEQAVLAAVLTTGAEALASHRTAAFLHRLVDRRPEVVEVTVPRWRRVQRDFVVHESKDLAPEDRAAVGSIPVTSAVRTVVDLGATDRWLVEDALDTGLRRGLFHLEEVAAFVDRVGRRGRRGVGVVRPLLAARLQWDGHTESALEDLFRKVLNQAGIPHPEPQVRISAPGDTTVCRADFAYPRARVRIELDSEAFHMDRRSFRRDRQQQNVTELLGWRTLRYTWWDLTERPGLVAEQIRAALSASPEPPLPASGARWLRRAPPSNA